MISVFRTGPIQSGSGVNIRRTIAAFLVLGLIAGCTTGCDKAMTAEKSSFNIGSINSYREIPHITQDEINTIEKLKSQRRSFSYGSITTTETFKLDDGTYAGFTPLFCKLLSDLFGIPFIPQLYDWSSLKDKVDSGTVDFTGVLTPQPKRRQDYFMSHPIAEHSLSIFTHGESKIKTEEDINGLKIGAYRDTITINSILDAYPHLYFDIVYLDNSTDVVNALMSDKIDAFVDETSSVIDYDNYPLIQSREFFPLVFTDVSVSTIEPELEAVISVIDKYLVAGGIARVHELSIEGQHEYARYELGKMFTDDEKAYLSGLAAKGASVPIALEPGNYPLCFYNESDKKFEGIAPDILKVIESLTGIKFEIKTNKNTAWPDILKELKEGSVSLVSELIYSDDRKDNFLWTDYPYSTYHLALLSKSDYPNLEMYEVISKTVGVGRDSAYEYFYNKWFPKSPGAKLFDTLSEGMTALEKGKVDLLMASEYDLLTLMNFYEKPGFKANIVFDSPVLESYFGFNKNETLLRSIVSKAQYFSQTDRIVKDWTGRVFDYSTIYANQRLMYMNLSAIVLSLVLIILIVLFVRNNRTKKLFKKQAITISAMYKSLPDLVFCMDTNCKYTSCNDLFEKFAGRSSVDIIGRNALEVYASSTEMARHFMETTQRVLKEHTALKEEEWVVYRDHSRHLLETIKAPLIQDGKITGVLGISRDITDHKAAEDSANKASRAKSEFLARMSHEIRTPMNAIIGMTELALRADKLDAAREHIFTVKQAGANLLSIINDILDFSKIETGKLEIIPGDYLFTSLVHDVISIIRMRVIDSQIRFAVNIDSHIPNALMGDELRIRQVLLNLLNNAVKYTEKGFVSFTVFGELTGDDTVRLSLEVMDSGRGIKKEDMRNLFGEYTQFDLEKNRFIEGTGLGLAITKSIVKAMDGDITVNSEYGKGSTFTVTLPQKIRSHEVLASVKDPGSISVIVFERREIFANSIVFAVDNLGVECTLVSSDSELQEKITGKTYSYIFISFVLYARNKAVITQFAANAKIVVLTEFGEAVPDSNLNILSMPVHSISIADILNGVSENFSYNENNELIVRFTAPDVRVLVVDDINTNLKVAEGLLVPYKMQVKLSKSGADAIEAAKTMDYDIIFMDHKMPEMDGVEATQRIRSMGDEDPYYQNVPIIALTANAVSGTKEMFINSGFNDFLSKPIDTVALNTILEKWIPREKRKAQAAGNSGSTSPAGHDTGEIKIEGIDTGRGISITGGSVEGYMETLALFYRDGIEKIREITACVESGNLRLYTIHVHGLKSASASIGAGALSDAARALEAAGEQKDSNFIEAHNEEFLLELASLLEKINRAITVYRGSSKGPPKQINKEALKQELAKLETALDIFDAGAINDACENLKNFAEEENVGELIKKISDCILIAEYDMAEQLIDKLLKENF